MNKEFSNKFLERLKERRAEWEEYGNELKEEIDQIKETNNFDESDLAVVNGKAKLINKDDARNIIRKVDNSKEPLNKRLVITKTVTNDTRRVKPRDEGKFNLFVLRFDFFKDEKGDREKKSKKERRKEIEIKRKRRHGSSSSSGESEDEYVERKPIMTKDVRRVAAKDDEQAANQEDQLPVNRRRITVKAPRQSDSSKSEPEKAKR